MISKIHYELQRIIVFLKRMPQGWLDALYNYCNYKDRTDRFGFWSFAIFNAFILFSLYCIDDYFNFVIIIFFHNMYKDIHILCTIYLLVTFIPYLFICIRRLHDLNCRGWWVLFVFIPIPYPYVNYFFGLLFLIAASYAGDKKNNRFGHKPIHNF